MQDIYESIDKFLTISEDKEDIFGILHFVQSKIGYIPNDVQQYIANKMNTSIENIKETIEISSHFVEEKTQNEILVCMGTTCSMKGSKFVFDEIQVTLKKKNVEKNIHFVEIFMHKKTSFSRGIKFASNPKSLVNFL